MSESLGLILLKAGLVTPKDLLVAHAHAHGSGEPLARRLVALGILSEEQIQRALAGHMAERSKPRLAPRLRPSLRPVPTKLRLH